MERAKELVDKYQAAIATIVMLGGFCAFLLNEHGKLLTAAEYRREMEVHMQHPHPGAVSRQEFEMLGDQIDKIERNVDFIRNNMNR